MLLPPTRILTQNFYSDLFSHVPTRIHAVGQDKTIYLLLNYFIYHYICKVYYNFIDIFFFIATDQYRLIIRSDQWHTIFKKPLFK